MSLLNFTKWMQCTAEHGHAVWTAISLPLCGSTLKELRSYGASAAAAGVALPHISWRWTLSSICVGKAGGEERSTQAGTHLLSLHNMQHTNNTLSHHKYRTPLMLFRKKPTFAPLNQIEHGQPSNPFTLPSQSSTYRPCSYLELSQPYLPTQLGRLWKWPKAGTKTQSSDRPQISPGLISTDSRLKGPKVFWELKLCLQTSPFPIPKRYLIESVLFML